MHGPHFSLREQKGVEQYCLRIKQAAGPSRCGRSESSVLKSELQLDLFDVNIQLTTGKIHRPTGH
jgi:hypothetical protein